MTGTPPENIVYYSLDDPARFRPGSGGQPAVFDHLMKYMGTVGKKSPAYLFLDEIQTLERWEQYIKKYYDLGYPVRFVISGSAASPIFKKSRESLLGRVKDYHILPFSFAEFLRFRLRDTAPGLLAEVDRLAEAGRALRGMLTEHPDHLATREVDIPVPPTDLKRRAEEAFRIYLIEGGFPEVWQLPTMEKKLEYLFDNQVKKVIHEDLVLAAEFRKPEQLKAFYISLLEQPGREVSLAALAKHAHINVQQIEKYVPLLEMIDLLSHVGRFRSSPIKVREGNRKFYLIDLALRNAVLRIGEALLKDEGMLGLYAENLVFNALKKWRGLLQLDYYHNGKKEVDFIAHTGTSRYLPVEVKFKNRIEPRELVGLAEFSARFKSHIGIVITKSWEDTGRQGDYCHYIPLLTFLMLMD